jgi:hypothetical protein
MYKVRNKPPLRKSRKKLFIAIAAAVLVLAAIITVLEVTDTTGLFHKRNPALETAPNTPKRTAGSNTKGETDNKDDGGQPSQPEQPIDNKDNNSANTAELLAPSGTFVGNHRPKPEQGKLQSVCVTTSGATCTIVFKMGSTTKQLPPQTTDKEGAAYWTWSLGDIGLTEGTWSIEAKATLSGQTKTAQDPTALEVGP